MAAAKLYSVGHLANMAKVPDTVVLKWERAKLLPTVGTDRRRFTSEAVARSIALGVKHNAATAVGATGNGEEPLSPVLAPGALAAAEARAEAAASDPDDTLPPWRQLDLARFVPHDGRKRLSSRFYGDAYRALTAAGATQFEAIESIAHAYHRQAHQITESLRRMGVLATVRGVHRGPATAENVADEDDVERDVSLEDQLDMLKDMKRIWSMLSAPFRELALTHILRGSGK